jgi:hypothetical protein
MLVQNRSSVTPAEAKDRSTLNAVKTSTGGLRPLDMGAMDGVRSSRRVLGTSWVIGIAMLVLAIVLIVPQVVHNAPSHPSVGATSHKTRLLLTGPPALLEVTGSGAVEVVSESTGAVLRLVAPPSTRSNFDVASVTADGRIAYLGTDPESPSSESGGSFAIERVPLDGGRPSIVVPHGLSPAVSPDGT